MRQLNDQWQFAVHFFIDKTDQYNLLEVIKSNVLS